MKRLFTLISYLVGIAIILALVLLLSKHEDFKARTVNYLSRQIKQHSGWDIEFQKVELVLPFTLKVEQIVVAKQLDTLLVAKNVSFSINPWELISHRIVFDAAIIDELTICGNWQSEATENIALDEILKPEDHSVLFGLKINELVVRNFLIVPEILHLYQLGDIALLNAPVSLRLNANLNPFEQQIFAEVAFTQNESPEITCIISAKKALVDWQAQIRVNIPPNSTLSDQIPFNNILNYTVLSQISLSPSLELLRGDVQLIYENEDSGDHLLGNYGSFQTTFLIEEGNIIEFSKFNGIAGPFILEGQGRYALNNELMDLQLSCIQCDDFLSHKFLDCGVQNGKINLRLLGTLANPYGEIHLQADECTYMQQQFDNLIAKCQFKYVDAKLSGEIEVHGVYEGTPAAITAVLMTENKEKIEIQKLRLNYGSNHISGDLSFFINNRLLQGDLQGEFDANIISSFANTNLKGQIAFNSNFYESDAQANVQSIDLTLQSPLLKIDQCSLERFALNVKGINPLNKSLDTLTANCQKVKINDWEAADLMLSTNTDPSLDHWPFSLTCRDTTNGKIELFSKGSWRYYPEKFSLTLDAFEGQIAQYPYRLQDSAELEFFDGKFTLSPLYFKIHDGTFFASCEITDTDLRSIIKVQDLPIGLIHVFDPTFPVDGSLSLDVMLSDGSQGVQGNMKAILKGMHLKDEKLSVSLPVDLNINANFQDNKLKCLGRAIGMGPHPFDLKAEIPMTVGLKPFKFEILKDQNLSLQAVMKGRIESYLELLMPANSTTITGNLSLALNVSGTFNEPHFVGKGDLADFSYEVSDLGLTLNKGNAHIDISKTMLTISNLQVLSSKGGVVNGAGQVELNPDKLFPFDMNFQLSKIPLSPEEYVATTISGDLVFRGNSEKALLEGNVVTDALKIEIPEHIPQLVHSVNVAYVNQPDHLPGPTTYKRRASDWPLLLNVEMDIPTKGYITGKDWESEWKGNIIFTGTSDAPLLNGTCTIKHGEYNFNGKPFQINQGTITFAGDLEKKTSVYVIAGRDLDTIRAEVIVKGLIKNPSIAFRSNPPLPQREILSWLLFNRGTSEINSFQGSQLNESITDLSTKGDSGPDMLTKFREKTGIDLIDINRKGGGSNEVSLQVGKYISRGILVSVNKSITAEANRLAIEAAVVKNVKIQAEVGDDSDAQLMLKWKKDY